MRGRVSKLRYGVLLALLLLPTTINETKVTLLFVPIGVLIVMIVGAEARHRLRVALTASSVVVFFVAAYIPIYDMMEVHNPDKRTAGILDFFGNQKKVSHYMSSNISGLGTTKDVRRGDAIMVPFQYLARDPVRLSLGLGLGSVAPSNLGRNFEGPMHPLFAHFMLISITYFMLELGMLGSGLILLLYWLLFRDSLAVANHDQGIFGAFAVGWTGVVVLMCIAIFYNSAHLFESLSYLFWYFSGVVAARRVQLAAPLRHRWCNRKCSRQRQPQQSDLGRPLSPASAPQIPSNEDTGLSKSNTLHPMVH